MTWGILIDDVLEDIFQYVVSRDRLSIMRVTCPDKNFSDLRSLMTLLHVDRRTRNFVSNTKSLWKHLDININSSTLSRPIKFHIPRTIPLSFVSYLCLRTRSADTVAELLLHCVNLQSLNISGSRVSMTSVAAKIHASKRLQRTKLKQFTFRHCTDPSDGSFQDALWINAITKIKMLLPGTTTDPFACLMCRDSYSHRMFCSHCDMSISEDTCSQCLGNVICNRCSEVSCGNSTCLDTFTSCDRCNIDLCARCTPSWIISCRNCKHNFCNLCAVDNDHMLTCHYPNL